MAEWVNDRIREPNDRAISILQIWTHTKRAHKITHWALQDLQNLNQGEMIEALNELH